MNNYKQNKKYEGSITIPLLIAAGTAIIILYGAVALLSLLYEYSNRQTAGEQSLNIAEAGISYYRWHLSHDPLDFKDGQPGNGPYIHEYIDPQKNKIGSYSLLIDPPHNGSSIVTITSTGKTEQYPSIKRTIKAQYGIPSLASYAFLQHGIMWYGSGITINGPIRSNVGIRMDGINNSIVSNYQAQYHCGGETGCDPPSYKNGVWGEGPNSSLWEYPSTLLDFNRITFDFDGMKRDADSSGLHLLGSGASGYHLVFQSNGTVKVYKVTSTTSTNGYFTAGQGLEDVTRQGTCVQLNQYISRETLINTYQLSSKPIIFVEDNIWVEGIIKGRVTVTAVRFPVATTNTNIWINNNLTYSAYDGSDVLGLIAENDIYFGRQIPDNFRVDASLMAQSGQIIRHRYYNNCGGTTQAIKNSLTIYGSIISYYKSYWNYGDPPTSGFRTRNIMFDPYLRYGPPPYFPVSGEYEFISWKED
jgi:hypothetical protein